MALDYFWNIVFYCGCRHFLAKTTLYFDQKKMPTWVSGQTKELISFRNSSAILATFSKRLWLNHDSLTQSNRGKSIHHNWSRNYA